MMSLGATRGDNGAAAEGNWTEYMKAFSGKLYRPDVAPPDDAETPAEPQPQREAIREPAPPPREQPIPQPVTPAVPTVAAAPVANGAKPKPALTNPLFEAIPPRKG
jgi:hypothetical protein